jgi:hypothetical protein
MDGVIGSGARGFGHVLYFLLNKRTCFVYLDSITAQHKNFESIVYLSLFLLSDLGFTLLDFRTRCVPGESGNGSAAIQGRDYLGSVIFMALT